MTFKPTDYDAASDVNAAPQNTQTPNSFNIGVETSVADHMYGAHWTADAEL